MSGQIRVLIYIGTCSVLVCIVAGMVLLIANNPKWDDWATARMLLLSIPAIFAATVFVPLFSAEGRRLVLHLGEGNKE